MRSVNLSELTNYIRKVGADNVVISSITNESSPTWTFYWRGIKATLTATGVNASIEVMVHVPHYKWCGYNDVTGNHFSKISAVMHVLRSAKINAVYEC